MKMLVTTAEVIEALGGTRKTADLLGYSLSRVSNYRQRERFPPSTYPGIAAALAKIEGIQASPDLWTSVPVSVISQIPNEARIGGPARGSGDVKSFAREVPPAVASRKRTGLRPAALAGQSR